MLRAGGTDSKRAGGPSAVTQPRPLWCHGASQLLGPLAEGESIGDSTWVGEGVPSKDWFQVILHGLVQMSGIPQASVNACCLSIQMAEAVVHSSSCPGPSTLSRLLTPPCTLGPATWCPEMRPTCLRGWGGALLKQTAPQSSRHRHPCPQPTLSPSFHSGQMRSGLASSPRAHRPLPFLCAEER